MPVLAALRRSATPRGGAPSWADGVLVLVLAVPSLWPARTHGIADGALAIAMALPLLWRRQAPRHAFAVAWAIAAVQGLVAAPTFSDCALLVILYTIGATQPRRTAATAWALLELGAALATAKFATPGLHRIVFSFVAMSALSTAALVTGINVGNRRQILAGLRERAERLEQEREQEVALARATERSRIAREMHDVVAHNLSVMTALCDGAAYHIHEDPDRAESALEQAARTGRQALAEMRQLLGVLRDAPAGPDRAPQPGVRQIDDLVEQIRAAGVPVSYSVTGDLGAAAPGLELAIYRIVQEALTNTLKHAGPGARAAVSLTCADSTVHVRVRDTGGDVPAPALAGPGAGLRGMRERAAVYGGTLEAGHTPHGGWEVRASLEMPAAVPASAP